MRDGERSRQRLLEAATSEFAAYGIAGARVDRIADAARVNKAQMYGWFGSKDGLFDAVFAQHLHRIVDVVPFTPDDLPGYAVALYDSYLTDPELVRLAGWHRLERVPTGELLAAHPGHADPKHQAIAQAQAAGRIVSGIRPDEVYALVIALAGTWSPISATFTASPVESQAEHDRRRGVLRDVVRRALVLPAAQVSEEERVLAAAVARATALVRRDAAALRARLHADFVWTSHLGGVLDRDGYVHANTGGDLRWHDQLLEDPHVVVVDRTAVLRCTACDDVDPGDGSGRQTFRMPMTQTWVSDGSDWTCLAGHAGPRAR